MTLYEVDKKYAEALEKAHQYCEENEDGVLSDELTILLEDLEEKKDQKISNICKVFKNLSANAKSIKEEEYNLKKRRAVVENKAVSLKKYLSTYMKAGEKFEDSASKISWRKSESVQLSLDAEDYPEEYQNVSITPNKAAIKKDLKKGDQIAGAELVSSMNIQIK